MKLFWKTSLQEKYPLVTWENEEILRTVCQEIKKITPEIRNFSHDIIELMREYKWVWLAAPQIGQNYRMAAITQWDTSHKNKLGESDRQLLDEFVIINPKILSQSDFETIESEACLSLPWVKGDVSRPDTITLQYLAIDGKTHIHKATWFNARVILHEMDHLDGVLFIDKLAE